MPAKLRLLGLAPTLTVAACGSVALKNDGGGDGAAGATGSGGQTGGGGSTSTGGQTGGGGSTSTGGQTGGGGSTSSGGQTGGGGSTGTGGHAGGGGSTGTGGSTGECICPANYNPVCGVDDKTYGNMCEAKCAGVAIKSQGECPTKVTIKVTVPADHPYCDQTTGCTGPTHVQILSADGKALTIVAPYCATSCTACTTPFCPINNAAVICPAPHGAMFTGTSLDWDGWIFKTSTCGANVSCTDRIAAPAGMYIARVCGTPGKLDNPDAGFQAKCGASGAEVCVDVPFELPGATTVVGKLP